MSQLVTNTLRISLSIFGLGLCVTLLTTASASATSAQPATAEVKPTASGSVAPAANGKKKKSTEMNFDDVLIYGKYHFSDEAVTTVEEDKVLDALLGVRTDFKDRMKKSASRH
jgi:hypothetical protein